MLTIVRRHLCQYLFSTIIGGGRFRIVALNHCDIRPFPMQARSRQGIVRNILQRCVVLVPRLIMLSDQRQHIAEELMKARQSFVAFGDL